MAMRGEAQSGQRDDSGKAPPDDETQGTAIDRRVSALDWPRIVADLDGRGVASAGPLLTAPECERLARAYDDDSQFRSHIVMARHGFGQGEYKYLAYPLPAQVAGLRAAFYARLAPVANAWHERMALAPRFPAAHADFLQRCHAAGQTRPTPLLLRYGPGDFNCLHQDVYGDLVFPLQVVVLLSRPGVDFEGGEFVVVEQRPRRQSRAEVVAMNQGHVVIFAVRHRPHRGATGDYRVNLKHGVSRVHSGRRQTLGIIFHDAT